MVTVPSGNACLVSILNIKTTLLLHMYSIKWYDLTALPHNEEEVEVVKEVSPQKKEKNRAAFVSVHKSVFPKHIVRLNSP